MTARDVLAGRRILVTRPAERAAGLAAAIAAAGGEPVHLPTIEIVPQAPGEEAVAATRSADVVIFASPAAVVHGVAALGLAQDFAPALAAVGPATAAALSERGLQPSIEPVDAADSEGLLRAPALAAEHIERRRVLIVRGGAGRDTLARTLMARGASVHYADVYRRERPRAPEPGLAAACDILTATSNEGLTNLLAMCAAPEQAVLLERPLAVTSVRAATLARERGFTHEPEIADGPGDSSLLVAIRRCAEKMPPARSRPSEPGPENE